MSQATQGDTVQVHYVGRLNDGKVFGTSQSEQPLQFTIGEGEVIPGLEKAILGMAEGESKSVEIPAAQGLTTMGRALRF
jgi:peptidylprolyl isomerase